VVKKALIALGGGLILALSAASPASAADTVPKVEARTVHSSLSPQSQQTLAQLQLRNLKTAETIRPFADPPGGGCHFPTELKRIAHYVNNTLVSLTADYSAQIMCLPTGPGQYMDGLLDTAGLWKGTTQIQEAQPVGCANCLVSPVSQGFSACNGVGCAGTYWGSGLPTMKAPAGWYWFPAPAGCIGLGPAPYEWIKCSVVTPIDVVPPTI
jgi:hypothetical protein